MPVGNLVNEQSQIRFLRQLQSGTNELPAGWAGEGSISRTMAETLSDSVSAATFGCRDDGTTDNRALLQGLIDELEPDGGAEIYLPRLDGGYYALSGPLALKSNVYLRGWGAGCLLKNTVGNVSPDRTDHVFMAGTYHPAYWNDLTYYTGNAISSPTNTFDCATVAQAGNFQAGDLVVVRSLQFYKGAGGHERPHFILCAAVVSANASNGEIVIDTIIDEALTDPQIAHLNGSGITPSATPYDTLYAPKNWGLLNMSLESATGSITELGGGINGTLYIHNWIARDGFYTNTLARTTAYARYMRVTRKAADYAAECHDFHGTIDHVEYVGAADPGVSFVLYSENTRRSSLHIRSCDLGQRAAGDPIKIQNARRSSIRIDRLEALNEIGNLLILTNTIPSPAPGSESNLTQPVDHDCSISVGYLRTGGGLQRYAFCGNAGGELRRPSIYIGYAEGACSVAGITVDGDNGLIDPRTNIGSQTVVASSGSSNWRGLKIKAGGLTNNGTDNLLSLVSATATFVETVTFDMLRQSAAQKDTLPDTPGGAAGDPAATPGAFGLSDTVGQVLQGNSTNNTQAINTGAFFLKLPARYRAGGSISIRFSARVSAARQVAQTIDCTVQAQAGTQTLGSDICATDAQAVTAGYLPYSFTVTPTGLEPGNVLYVVFTGLADDINAAAPSAGTFQVRWIDAVLAEAA